MTGTVTVYFNTGFNGVDIPASAAVLANASQKSYSDVYFMREDIDKPSIKIKDSYDNLCAVDYCAITTPANGTSYFFAVPSALSKGVTLLSLDLDALLTMGGASNLNYISGWQERGHIAKADDKLFDNIAAEDWRPSQPLENHDMTTLRMTSSVNDDLDIVISNIDLGVVGQNDDVQKVMSGKIDPTDPDAVMYWPEMPVPSTATAFYMWDYLNSDNMNFKIPNTAAYNVENTTVKQGLKNLFSAGQLQLQNSYKIPKEYVGSVVVDGQGRYTSITGNHAEKVLSEIPFEYGMGGYTPKNKKVYATYRQIALCAIGSGDMIVKSPEDLYDGSSIAPTIRLWADMASTGKPYARWGYIKGSVIPFSDCVKGLQWANNQLVMEGASGSMWNAINTSFANQQLERSKEQNLFNLSGTLQGGSYQAQIMANEAQRASVHGLGEIASLMMTPLTSGGGAKTASERMANRAMANINAGISGMQTGYDLMIDARNLGVNLDQLNLQMSQAKGNNALANQQIQQQINQNNIGLIKSNQVIAPTVSFTPEQNLGLYGYNYFVAFQTIKSLDDLKSEDMYYQRYGYNGLHRPLTQQCFNERQYYCYVQAFDVNLKGSREYGLRVRNKAISQLNAGVRVWKVLPDASYYETN